jgi:ligand-binding SRPBCC domain-containing protein
MRVHRLTRRQWVARPLQRVFPFFAQPENLALITPPALAFRLLTPEPVIMEQGRHIDYTLHVLGLPTRWRTLISHFDPPLCFVDEQLAGPYSFWHHTHRFSEQRGGTLLEDEVRYALPVLLPWPVRDIVHALYVRPTLERIFDYRAQVYARLFGGGGSATEPAAPAGMVRGEGGL